MPEFYTDSEDEQRLPRRRRNLTTEDLEAIKAVFDAQHPCSNFTADEVHTVKEVVTLLTPENIQGIKDLLTFFRDGKKTIFGGVKVGLLLLLLFFIWLAYQTGFLVKVAVKGV